MDASFWLKLLLSFFVGSFWVTLTTLSAERFGSRIGGVIGGLPSTVVITLLFIGITQSPQVAARATTVMPFAQGLNGLFVLAFIVLISTGLGTALSGALMVWFAQSTLLYLLQIKDFWISIVGWLVLLAFCVVMLEMRMKVPTQGSRTVVYSASHIAWRAIFGGAVIALAVLIGKIGGAMLGGIFGSFPAIFLTTLTISYQTHGVEFSRAVGKSILVSGLVNVPIYEIIVRYLYPTLGLLGGTAIALMISFGTGYLTYMYLKDKTE